MCYLNVTILLLLLIYHPESVQYGLINLSLTATGKGDKLYVDHIFPAV